MQVDFQNAGITTLQQMRRAQDKNVQNVFSQVLRDAGRQGYASAEQADSPQALGERVQQSWDDWYQTELVGRYASKEAPQDLGQTFGNVLKKAYDAGAYAEPKSFLKSLSSDELKAVQNAHWLAEPIQVDSLTEEGSLNLLIPPAAQVDLNGDGLTQSGAAYGLRFPDSTTPPEVRQAWEQATDGMPFGEQMAYELQMKSPTLLANLVTNADGNVVGQREPGDPDFVNPMNDKNYSFVGTTQKWLDYLDAFKNQMAPEQFERGMNFWKTFQTELRNHGVA